MKRLNPNTGKPFKRGDTREDGYIFHTYQSKIKQDGFQVESWASPESFQRINIDARNRANKVKANPKIHKKSINPKTGKHWLIGEKNKATNKIFMGYQSSVDLRTNNYYELWAENEEAFEKRFITDAVSKIKVRCKKKGTPCDIDSKYAISIFPKDKICPALGVTMKFGGGRKDGRQNSPSIDRIIPAKGYVKGNVRWVSYLANAIMNEANADQILKVGKWLEKQGKLERNPRGEE